MIIRRHLEDCLKSALFKGKTIVLYGARQTGKTTLVDELLSAYKQDVLVLNGDNVDVRALLTDANPEKLKIVIGTNKIVLIDEAQRIPECGLVLKVIHDNFKNIQLIATGSSSFEISNKIKEPLTGRKFEYTLYPFSIGEMVDHHGFLKERRLLEHRLIYGYYPDIAVNIGEETKLLKSLASSYLYKDLLMLESIKKPVLLEKILSALALQVGSEVSYNELAQLLHSDKETIEKYIDLLERNYIIFRLRAFSRNVRNEIKRSRKIYFYDNGIRNAILGNFNSVLSRTDVGALWENFLISERIKYLNNKEIEANSYFWRTSQQQEIDYIEEHNEQLNAWEFKWNPGKKVQLSKTFEKAYPNTQFKVISKDNFEGFLL